MTVLTTPDLMTLGGYFLGAYGFGWCIGLLFRGFERLWEKTFS